MIQILCQLSQLCLWRPQFQTLANRGEGALRYSGNWRDLIREALMEMPAEPWYVDTWL